MADEEMEAIRKQQISKLQAKQPELFWRSGTPTREQAGGNLAHVLKQAACAQSSNLALVKPEKAKAVENSLIQITRNGQFGGKISALGLIEILEKVNQQTDKKNTVKFNRRKVRDYDDED